MGLHQLGGPLAGERAEIINNGQQSKDRVDTLDVTEFVRVGEMPAIPGQQEVALVIGGQRKRMDNGQVSGAKNACPKPTKN